MIISKMDNQGRGITHFNDKIVFVNNALPTEDVEINLILDKNKYSIANVKKYNKISKERKNPKCPYYGICGGCQLQHISYDSQLKYKVNYINDLFKDLGLHINQITHGKQFNYRDKITLKKVSANIGFCKINSNQVVNIKKCEIADNIINNQISLLQKLSTNDGDEIIIKNFNGKSMLVVNSECGINHKLLNDLKKEFYCIYQNNKLIYGNRMITTIKNIKYLIAPNGFFQINLEIATKLFDIIRKICQKINSKNVIDLYCGCGSISLYIANCVDSVLGIELNQSSINDANKNIELNNIKNVTFKCDTADNIIFEDKYDTLIVDPPRKGLSKNIINKIINKKIKHLIYVSCDPITLKRDLILLKNYYNIDYFKIFDMFPNTYHVECVSVLHRKSIEK